MTQESYKCIKCGHEAARRLLVDYSDEANFVAKWVEGEPHQVSILEIAGTNI